MCVWCSCNLVDQYSELFNSFHLQLLYNINKGNNIWTLCQWNEMSPIIIPQHWSWILLGWVSWIISHTSTIALILNCRILAPSTSNSYWESNLPKQSTTYYRYYKITSKESNRWKERQLFEIMKKKKCTITENEFDGVNQANPDSQKNKQLDDKAKISYSCVIFINWYTKLSKIIETSSINTTTFCQWKRIICKPLPKTGFTRFSIHHQSIEK